MRALLAIVVLPLVVHARVCGTPDAAASVEVDAKGSNVVPPALTPTHGGQIVYANSVPMEVVVKGNGAVQAYPVATIQGQPPALPTSAQITVNVPVVGGAPKPVRLAWRGPDAYFAGTVHGAVVAPGPLSVVVQADGQRYETIAPVYVTPVVVTGPSVVVQPPSASVVVGGPVVGVVAPPANVYVGGPAVDVRVNVPSVSVGVGVPPGVVVVGDDDDYRGGYRRDYDAPRAWGGGAMRGGGGDWDDGPRRGGGGGDWDDGRGRGGERGGGWGDDRGRGEGHGRGRD